MKFPVSMLRDFVSTDLDAVQLGDLLTMAGFELEGIDEVEGDHALDIKVMSNRGDGLSVFGLAREVLAKDGAASATELYGRMARTPSPSPSEGGRGGVVSVETTDCSRYGCRFFEGASPQSSPEWLQKRLRQAGMRPLGLVVDISNYVMLELGQPLHAFDRDKLSSGRIVVRRARFGEKLTTLNGDEHVLREDQMMICDAERPVAAAGIMGGLDTEVTDATRNILLESAHFLNTSVRRTRKQMGLNTEASYRFERSVDPEGAVRALDRFAELYSVCGGSANCLPELEDVYPHPPEIRSLQLRINRSNQFLGMNVPQEDAIRYLRTLGFRVVSEPGTLTVEVPTWRPDIVREEDVIEEIGRVHGFDQIPEALPPGSPRGGQSAVEQAIDDLRQKLIGMGFVQCISHTLADEHPLDAPGARVGPRNPGSPDHALLRNSALPSLAEASQRNGGRDLHLFETGRVFSPDSESRTVALLSHGQIFAPHRAKEPIPSADFFSLKGVIEELAPGLFFGAPEVPDGRLHPTKQATLGMPSVGILGEIHPDVANASGISRETILAELDLDALAAASLAEIHFHPISRNPSVRRDIAFVASKSLAYGTIQEKVEKACGEVLEEQWLFDVYEGPGIPEGSHSLAIALQLRKFGENFTDEEANQVREMASAALESLGATIRR